MSDGTYELLRTIQGAFLVLGQLDNAITFGLLFIWLIGWYILYQMHRLSFLKLLMAGDVLFILLWFLRNRHLLIGHPEEPISMVSETLMFVLGGTLRIGGTIFTAMGVCMGVRYLQRTWAAKVAIAEPPSDGATPDPTDTGAPGS